MGMSISSSTTKFKIALGGLFDCKLSASFSIVLSDV